ncbi:MAG: GWxTD domain-containing protein [Calditrichaeota bacterium]|nr:MAG: GWxTD domain-containing protein [Calditrichota bacterium]
MNLRYALLPVLFVSLVAGLVFGQQASYIPLQVDYALFKADSNRCFMEVYLSFYQKNMRYVASDSGFQARFTTRIEIYDGDSLLLAQDKNFVDQVPSMAQITPGRQFLDMYAYKVRQGDYRVRLIVKDLEGQRQGEFEFTPVVHPYPTDRFSISDLQLCTRIMPARGTGRFSKGRFQVIPNPSGIYGVKLPVIYYYAEVYNLAPPGEKGTYTVEAYVTDMEGNEIRRFPAKTYSKKGKDAAIIGGYNIVTLEGKPYNFHLQVRDDDTGELVQKTRRFLMFKHADQFASVTISDFYQQLRLYYQSQPEEKLDEEFNYARYVATDAEKKVWESLNREGKIDFLIDFWKRRDTNPETPENEYRQEYLTLVYYANEHFTIKNKPGWESDRGRVLLTYGRPDQIDRNVSRSNMKPYEVWHYNRLEEGVVFVFADFTGFGDYQLVHSSYSKEVHHPEWEQYLEDSRFPENPTIQDNGGD